MKKLISITLLTAILTACGTQTAPQAKPAFIIVNDDSGVLTQPERAYELKLLMLSQLKALRAKKRFAQAKLQIISSSFGRTIFVGSISDLETKRAADLVAQIENNASYCNRLRESFAAVQTSIRQLEQQGYTDIYVYFFSSLISTPSVCKDDLKITLPQLPVPVDFKQVLTANNSVSAIGFYYTNPYQLRAYQDALIPVATWANTNGKSFGIFDIEDSVFQLSNGLLGVK